MSLLHIQIRSFSKNIITSLKGIYLYQILGFTLYPIFTNHVKRIYSFITFFPYYSLFSSLFSLITFFFYLFLSFFFPLYLIVISLTCLLIINNRVTSQIEILMQYQLVDKLSIIGKPIQFTKLLIITFLF